MKRWYCEGCKTDIKEKAVISRAGGKEIFMSDMDFDLLRLDLQFERNLTNKDSIGYNYHKIMYNKNGASWNGAMNFCAGYRSCGPVVEREVSEQEEFIDWLESF